MLRGPDTRLRFIATLLITALLPIVGQLVRLQVLEPGRYRNELNTIVRRQYALPEPPWGLIMDRHDDLLVSNVPVYNVGAEVSLVRDPQAAAELLAPLLNRPAAELARVLTAPPESDGVVWRPLATHIPEAEARALMALRLSWLTLAPTWERSYTEGALAAHLLGFVNQDGFGYGVHAFQLRFLRGERFARIGAVSGDTIPMPDELLEGGLIPYPGTDLQLTIDRTLQAFVEGELEKAIHEFSASGGTIIVMNPRTGEILAMANYPSYEPARYHAYAAAGQEDIFLNPAVSELYEPGSVFKVVTVAAALDSGRVTRNWSYNDIGIIEYGGIVIRNAAGVGYGQQSLEELLVKSLNVGSTTLSTRILGPTVFYNYVRSFGFGQTTGIELAGEVPGSLRLPSDWDWSDSHLATNSFGQGIAVTPLQMTAAVAAIANEGEMLQPRIIAERRYPDGRVIPIPPRSLGRPISPETAQVMIQLMESTVEHQAMAAKVEGYRIAGKGGTSQIPTIGGYEREDVITSFVGFGPLPDPEVVILVKIDRPRIARHLRWGIFTAAPVFERVASRAFVLLGIPPTDLRAGP